MPKRLPLLFALATLSHGSPIEASAQSLSKSGGSSNLDATVITAQIFRDSGNTLGLGNNALLPSCLSGGDDSAEDAWYQVTLSKNGRISAWTTCAAVGPPSFDTRLAIFDASLALQTCNDDDPGCALPNRQSRITNYTVSAGTYYIVVDGWNGLTGPYELNVEWQENGPSCNGSDSTNPTMIPALPFVDGGDLSSDCDDYLVSCELGGMEGGADHWYQLTLDADVLLDVDTGCDAGLIDTRIAILNSNLDELYCNDDDPGCASSQARIDDALLPAGSYYIVVDNADFAGGMYSVQVDTTHAPPGAIINLLPDLITRQGELFDNDVVTTIVPGRTHLRFSNSTANIGIGKLHLYGVFPVNPDGTQDVRQRMFNDFGSFTDRDAGVFVYHAEHGHIHVEDWAEYRIRYITADDGVGAIITSGPKVSFCIIDLIIHDATLPGFPAGGEFHDCNTTIQGQSVGWADTYSKELTGQNIDITDIPDGVYWLESEVDPTDSVLELDETNNVTRIEITIGNPQLINADAYEPNDTQSELDSRGVGVPNSPVLGPCGPIKSVSNLTVHSNGNDDYFRFYMPEIGSVADQLSIDFLHAQGDLNLKLLDMSGTVVDSSVTTADVELISLDGVAAGWYDAMVYGEQGALQPDYTITVDPSENGTPTITVVDPPTGDIQVAHGFETYTTTWTSNDPEGNETWISVYANSTPVLDGNEILLPTSQNTPGAQGLFVINTAYLVEGTYYIYMEITDGGTRSGDWSDGTITLLDLTAVEDLGSAYASRLFPNIPNPFNPVTILRVQLRTASPAHWAIYDVRGALVRTLVDENLGVGLHERKWSGRDDRGGIVASGVYYSVFQSQGFSGRQKLLLLK